MVSPGDLRLEKTLLKKRSPVGFGAVNRCGRRIVEFRKCRVNGRHSPKISPMRQLAPCQPNQIANYVAKHVANPFVAKAIPSMPKFPPSVDELVEEFEELEDWDERYDLIIDLGRELPEFPAALQSEENVVTGCMSTVWLVTSVIAQAKKVIEIQADSDSIIVKGLIVILLAHYSGKTAAEILESDASVLFERLGLNHHLSPQRRNGLYSMVKRLKQLAQEQS